MDKLIALLKSMPVAWRVVLIIAMAVVVLALSFQSCVMIRSSANTEGRFLTDSVTTTVEVR